MHEKINASDGNSAIKRTTAAVIYEWQHTGNKYPGGISHLKVKESGVCLIDHSQMQSHAQHWNNGFHENG